MDKNRYCHNYPLLLGLQKLITNNFHVLVVRLTEDIDFNEDRFMILLLTKPKQVLVFHLKKSYKCLLYNAMMTICSNKFHKIT